MSKPPPENLEEALDDLRGAFYWMWQAIRHLRRWFP